MNVCPCIYIYIIYTHTNIRAFCLFLIQVVPRLAAPPSFPPTCSAPARAIQAGQTDIELGGFGPRGEAGAAPPSGMAGMAGSPFGIVHCGMPPSGVPPAGIARSGMSPSGMPPSGIPSGMPPSGTARSGMAPSSITPSGVTSSGITPSGMAGPPLGMTLPQLPPGTPPAGPFPRREQRGALLPYDSIMVPHNDGVFTPERHLSPHQDSAGTGGDGGGRGGGGAGGAGAGAGGGSGGGGGAGGAGAGSGGGGGGGAKNSLPRLPDGLPPWLPPSGIPSVHWAPVPALPSGTPPPSPSSCSSTLPYAAQYVPRVPIHAPPPPPRDNPPPSISVVSAGMALTPPTAEDPFPTLEEAQRNHAQNVRIRPPPR